MVRAGTSRWRRSFTGIEDGVERPGVKAADSGVGGGGGDKSQFTVVRLPRESSEPHGE